MSHEADALEAGNEPFPWHLGIYDSHCHPTDSMKSIGGVKTMKARALTIMATRAQDQDLVAQVASDNRLDPANLASTTDTSCKILPSFGWHPWFSHQIYDDTVSTTKESTATADIDKVAHYSKVLTSNPTVDLISGLPTPHSLSSLLDSIRQHLTSHPHALLGEVGLDRSFRVPENFQWREHPPDTAELTPGTHHDRRLTNHKVDLTHQKLILKAQLKLAAELDRAVSLHVVGGQGAAFDLLHETWKGHERHVQSDRERKRRGSAGNAHAHEPNSEEEGSEPRSGLIQQAKPYPPRVCLHSFSGPPETVRQFISPEIPVAFYFSFSEVINFSVPENAQAKTTEAIKVVPDDRLLIESDLHIAGERMDELLEKIVKRVCSIRGWSVEDGVKRLASNWKQYVFGEDLR